MAFLPGFAYVPAMSSPSTFDVIVIGGGPGGYIAAIRAAELDELLAPE